MVIILFVPGVGGGVSVWGEVNYKQNKTTPPNPKLQHIQKLISKMKGEKRERKGEGSGTNQSHKAQVGPSTNHCGS